MKRGFVVWLLSLLAVTPRGELQALAERQVRVPAVRELARRAPGADPRRAGRARRGTGRPYGAAGAGAIDAALTQPLVSSQLRLLPGVLGRLLGVVLSGALQPLGLLLALFPGGLLSTVRRLLRDVPAALERLLAAL
ncbi:MAG: hypothetical protein KY433_08130 [Actinobacteria bacterium]|nr:hypothetical protein [Actinomycetota bacterium]